MNDMARTYLRQAKGFASAGDSSKAAELLERAAVLVRQELSLSREITEELRTVYERLGRYADAQRLQSRLDKYPAPAPDPSAIALSESMMPPAPQPSNARAIVLGFTIVAIVLAGIGGIWIWRGGMNTSAGMAVPMPPALLIGSPAPSVAQQLSAAPATFPSTQPVSREELLRDNVALLVVSLKYADQQEHWQVPISQGTAFAVSYDGLLITNRHVIEPDQSAFPTTLEELGKPTVTLRGLTYLVCWSKLPTDRFEATVVYKSDKFDSAVLKIGRRFSMPLRLSPSLPHQGDEAWVAGYPGIVQELLDKSKQTPDAVRQQIRKYMGTGNMDLVDMFSDDSFRSTLTRGIVSQPERNIEGAAYLQIDASIAPGNSGGPVLNAKNEVVGIVTSGIFGGTGNYNFAMRLDQLKEELEKGGVRP